MFNTYANTGGFWIWIMWMAFVVLIFSSFGHWGYAYRVQRRYGTGAGRNALDILNERYARGEMDQIVYARMKSEISSSS